LRDGRVGIGRVGPYLLIDCYPIHSSRDVITGVELADVMTGRDTHFVHLYIVIIGVVTGSAPGLIARTVR